MDEMRALKNIQTIIGYKYFFSYETQMAKY